jgi:bacterioferritin-associated ferredoxin
VGGAICRAVADGELTTVAEIKACTRAGTGCGGCVPFVAKILENELAALGREIDRKAVTEPKLLIVHYNDGLRISLFELNPAVGAWSAAWRNESRSARFGSEAKARSRSSRSTGCPC